MMADRADTAESLHQHRQLPERPALDELLEPSELDDVQSRLLHLIVRIEQQRDLAVALDPRHRFDDDAPELIGIGGGFEWGWHGRST
jgi:hypothetical protein